MAACFASGPGSILLGVETVYIGDTELSVLVADEPDEQRRGLAGVTEVPFAADGMLFVFGDGAPHTFSMEGTLIPLDIWWFSEEGELVGWTEMPLCAEGSCPNYRSPGPIGWAFEAPAGEYRFELGSTLTTG